MNLTANTIKPNGLIDGVHREVIVTQHERTDELNQRLASRYFPDIPLEPNFSSRPLSTKYNLPMLVAPTVPISQGIEHNVQTNFNPASRTGPYKTYARNIDTETVLRNQTMALQHSSQSVYVPSSTSDLYRVEVVARPVAQPYAGLFDQPTFVDRARPNLAGIGQDRFFNSTRTQLRQ